MASVGNKDPIVSKEENEEKSAETLKEILVQLRKNGISEAEKLQDLNRTLKIEVEKPFAKSDREQREAERVQSSPTADQESLKPTHYGDENHAYAPPKVAATNRVIQDQKNFENKGGVFKITPKGKALARDGEKEEPKKDKDAEDLIEKTAKEPNEPKSDRKKESKERGGAIAKLVSLSSIQIKLLTSIFTSIEKQTAYIAAGLSSRQKEEAEKEGDRKKAEAEEVASRVHEEDNKTASTDPAAGKKKGETGNATKEPGGGGLLAGILGGVGAALFKPEKFVVMIGEFLMRGVSDLFRGIASLLPELGLKAIMKFLLKGALFLDIIVGLFSGISDAIDTYKKGGSIWDIIKSFLSGFIESVTFGLIDKDTLEKIGDFVKPFVEKYIVNPISDVMNWIGDKFTDIWNTVKDTFEDFTKGIERFFEDAGDTLRGVVVKLGAGITNIIGKFLSYLGSLETPEIKVGSFFGHDITIPAMKPFSGLADIGANMQASASTAISDLAKKNEDTAKTRADQDAEVTNSRQARTEAQAQAVEARKAEVEKRDLQADKAVDQKLTQVSNALSFGDKKEGEPVASSGLGSQAASVAAGTEQLKEATVAQPIIVTSSAPQQMQQAPAPQNPGGIMTLLSSATQARPGSLEMSRYAGFGP